MKQAQTTKIAFIVKDNKIIEKQYTFNFYGGFALSQKQKTIDAFHEELKNDGLKNILEVSRKSKNQLGNALSAFNLMLNIKGITRSIESVYQSSKVFNNNIQFKEVLDYEPLMAKRFIKENVEKNNLILTSFNCFGIEFPLYPITIFYDYIYVLALSQHNDIASNVIKNDCFTDIEFNHKKQHASQARSCAIFKYLYDNKLVSISLDNFNEFKKVYFEIVPYELNLELL